MVDTDLVPEYRIVVGQYTNRYGHPLIIQDPNMSFINEQRYRFGVRELEAYAKKEGMLFVQDASIHKLIRELLGFEPIQFAFSSAAIFGILDSIRRELMDSIRSLGPDGAKIRS